MELKQSVHLGGVEFSIETGKIAKQAALIFSRSLLNTESTGTPQDAFPAITSDAKAAHPKKKHLPRD
jgi:hypothetical protein